MFGLAEIECWGAGAKGSRHARSGVGMTGQVDVEKEEPVQRFRAGGAGPLVGISPSYECDVRTRVVIYDSLKVEAWFW